jgi:hypothetical protein
VGAVLLLAIGGSVVMALLLVVLGGSDLMLSMNSLRQAQREGEASSDTTLTVANTMPMTTEILATAIVSLRGNV